MPLALVVDKIDSVPEALRPAYVEKDGKFHLDAEFEDTTGLKNALKSERELRAKYEKDVKAWQKTGKSPDEIAELLNKLADDETKALTKKGDVEAILAQHRTKWDGEKTTLQSERDTALSIARSALVDTGVLGALAKAKVTAEGSALLQESLGKRVQLEFVDGKPVHKIMSADGKTPLVGAGADGLATYDDLVKEAVKNFPSLFEGTGKGGTGKGPKDNGGGPAGSKTLTRSEFDALTPLDKQTKIRGGFTVVD